MEKVTKKELIKLFEGLEKYNLVVEKKTGWFSRVHIVYWDNQEKRVKDILGEIASSSEEAEWIEAKREEAKKGYLTAGVTIYAFKSLPCGGPEYHFDFPIKEDSEKIPLLVVYVGVELWKELEETEKYRAVVYQKKGLDLKKVIEMLKWDKKYDGKYSTLLEMDKPPVFFQAMQKSSAEEKPYADLIELFE